MITCPYCAEQIQDNIRSCPYCGSNVSGARSRRSAARKSNGSNLKWIIIIAAVVGGAVVILPCTAALMLPAVQQAREAARRTHCANNLKQIGIALQNYHHEWGTYPPAYMTDENGNRMHSWRVLILPYLEDEDGQATAVYQQYDFSEPWNGPNNIHLVERIPAVYLCPSTDPEGANTTAYAAIVGDECVFAGAIPKSETDVLDGLSNTIIVGEADGAGILWTEPRDIKFDDFMFQGDPDGFSSPHSDGGNFLRADGSVHFQNEEIDPEILRAMFTRSGQD